VRIEPVYDRSDLIHRAIDTLIRTLAEESVVVAVVCFVFPDACALGIRAIVTLPVGILMAFLAMHLLGNRPPTS